MVRDGARAELLDGEGIGWLGDAQPASDVEHMGMNPPTSPSGPEGVGMHPSPGGGTTGVRCLPVVGHMMGANWAAWVMPGWHAMWLEMCPRVGHVI